MATVMEVMARLTGDASGMVGAFKKARSSAEVESSKIKRAGQEAKKAIESMALPAAAVATGGILFAKKIGDMASAAEQNLGAVDAVFKQHADEVIRQSERASSRVGLSGSKYQEFSVLLGSQLKNLGMPFGEVAKGSQLLVEKGADLASMFGGTTADAVSALSALLRGEYQSIERYGVSVKETAVKAELAAQGLDGLSGEAAKQARLQVLLKLLNDQTADSMGNFAREANTTAGAQQRANARWEEAQTNLGKHLLPMFTRLADMLSTVANWVAKNTEVVMVLGGVVMGLAGMILALNVAFKAWAAWIAIVAAANRVLATSMKAIPLFWIVTALMAVVAGLILAYNKFDWFKNFVDGAWGGIKDFFNWAIGGLNSIRKILFEGDFDGNLFGLHEDSWLVDWLFKIRDAGKAVVGWFKDTAGPAMGEFFGNLGRGFKRLGEIFVVPAMEGMRVVVGSFVRWWKKYVAPGLTEAVGALGDVFMALWEAVIRPVFKWAKGIIKSWWDSSGGVMQGAVDFLHDIFGPAWKWLKNNILGPIFTWAGEKIAKWWKEAKKVLKAAERFIRDVLGPGITWWLNDVVTPSFKKAGEKITNWWQEKAKPALKAANAYLREKYGPTIRWWYKNVIKPSFESAQVAIKTWWTVSRKPLKSANSYFRDTLGPTMRWFKREIVKPVMELSGAIIKETWKSVIRPAIRAFNGFLRNTLGPTLQWFFGKRVEPNMNKTGNKTKSTWDKMRPIFKNMREGIRLVGAAFGLANGVIGDKWDKIKNTSFKAVKWLINTVFNNGLIKGFNKLADMFGTSKIDPIKMRIPGSGSQKGTPNATGGPNRFMATGGTVPGYSPSPTADNIPIMATAREFMVRRQSAMRLQRNHPGALEYINKHGKIPGIDGYAKGGFIWPVPRGFPITQYPSAGHPAYDIGTPIGTRVGAAAAGRVTHAGAGYRAPGVWGGNEVHLQHGGIGSLYAHLSRIMVQVGQMVKQGQTIGASGNTGISSGPHLHFGGLQGSYGMVSPAPYLNGRAIKGGKIPGGGGGFSIADILSKVTSRLTGLVDKFQKLMPGGKFGEMLFGAVKKAAAGMIGLFDSGGKLRPGGMAINRSGQVEGILNNRQMKNVEKIANSGGSVPPIVVNINIRGNADEKVIEKAGKKAAKDIYEAVQNVGRGGVWAGKV